MLWHLVEHMGALEMVVWHFSMRGEDMIEHTNAQCRVYTFKYARGRYS